MLDSLAEDPLAAARHSGGTAQCPSTYPVNINGVFLNAASSLLTLTQRTGPAVAPSDVLATTRQLFEQAVAVIARRHNFLRAPKLPGELWCMVWQDLPLADRLRVTHVCHDWRALCLTTPQIWRYIDYCFYRHEDNCKCMECGFQREASRPVRTNALLVSLALPRSMPLELDVFIGDKGRDHRENIFSSSDPVSYLSHLLRPHKHRIRTIRADIFSGSLLTNFLDELRDFPALTSLTATSAPDNRSSLGASLANELLSMPALERLSLTHGWAGSGCDQSFPAVKSLQATYGWSRSLRRLIEACPNVTFLDIAMSHYIGNGHERGSDELAACISAFPSVRVSGMTIGTAKQICFMGRPPADVEYAYVNDVDSDGLKLCWRGLDDIERFTCRTDGRTVRLRAHGTHGAAPARRTLTFPLGEDIVIFCPLGTLPSLAALRSVAVDWPVWGVVGDCMPVLPRLETLSFYFPLDRRLHDPPDIDDSDDPVGADRFPMLKVVTFRGGTPEWATVIPRSWWTRFLGTLELSSSVRLKYDGVILGDGDEDEDEEDSD
ncbi:hypothetical protein AURDEDRAFT_127085 [Auricularia subglabra TFB-10046 SS5]|uniref:F-box domain-containing protein n=1 Tax=Auricularia subglabra (strain TFB-10046 / SS5) TaxID=717982 RepID=J0WYM4_AURST|nr:hypothetical protein AURDEDRAFT_127085 [Auricularia subglabra TFB-10046 SS5]